MTNLGLLKGGCLLISLKAVWGLAGIVFSMAGVSGMAESAIESLVVLLRTLND